MKIMKTIAQTFIAGALLLALTVTSASAQVMKKGKATVRAIHGDVSFAAPGSTEFKKLKVNQVLLSGSSVRTGADSFADMSVNGNHSTVRVTPSTTLKIDDMEYLGSTSEGDTKTTLNLQSGVVLGNVKKLSQSSDYDIRTPNGVAGIRGTDFAVKVEMQPDGKYRITFTSVTGQLVCAAIIPGIPNAVTKVLNDGQSWTPGSDVVDSPLDLLKRYQTEIAQAIANAGNGSIPPVTTPPPPIIVDFTSPGTGTTPRSGTTETTTPPPNYRPN